MTAQQNRNGFLEFLYAYYSELQDKRMIIMYEGEITHSVMKSFSSLAEEVLIREREPDDLQRKIYHVIVESLQNINHHAIRDEQNKLNAAGRGAFILCNDESYYHIVTGNLIPLGNTAKLAEMMDRINGMNDSELFESYKKQLKDGHISEEGGAGVGFIDLRRKTGQKIEYRLEQASPQSAYYLFTIKIPRKERDGNDEI